jgi:hypothetical protein
MTTTDIDWTVLDVTGEKHLVDLLLEIAEYAGPGFTPDATTNWYHLALLGELEMVTYGPEPLGTYGPDGREEYGTVVHVTEYGKEEVDAHRTLRAAA